MSLSRAYGGAATAGPPGPRLLVVTKSGSDWSTVRPHPGLQLLAPSNDVLVLIGGWYVTADGPVLVSAGDTIALPNKPKTQAVTGPWSS